MHIIQVYIVLMYIYVYMYICMCVADCRVLTDHSHYMCLGAMDLRSWYLMLVLGAKDLDYQHLMHSLERVVQIGLLLPQKEFYSPKKFTRGVCKQMLVNMLHLKGVMEFTSLDCNL